jgi:hypothetical protein
MVQSNSFADKLIWRGCKLHADDEPIFTEHVQVVKNPLKPYVHTLRIQKPKRTPRNAGNPLVACRIGAGSKVLFHPSRVLRHPALQEGQAAFANAAVRVEQAIFGVDKHFGLAQRGHIQIAQNVA